MVVIGGEGSEDIDSLDFPVSPKRGIGRSVTFCDRRSMVGSARKAGETSSKLID